MPSFTFRVGVASVSLALSTSNAIGSYAAVTMTASAITVNSSYVSGIQQALPAGTTYKVVVAPLGEDQVNGGYTVGVAVAEQTSAMTLTAGQGIHINISQSQLATVTNIANQCAMAVFLKIGSADYQLAGFAYVNPQTAFDYTLISLPLITSPYFNYTSYLSTTAADPAGILGSRTPYGWTFVTLGPTSGGVQVTRDVSQVTFSPDNSADFPVATTRSTTITFSTLPNDVLDIVRAATGTYVNYTSSGTVIENAQQSLATAQGRLTGNKPFLLTMPPDSQGYREVRMYLGNLTTNQTGFTESWTRQNPTLIQYTYNTALQDLLLVDQATEIITKVL